MTSFGSRPPELGGKFFDLLFSSAEIATFTPETRIKYENDMTTERDRINQLSYARDTAFLQGEAKGEARGREEGVQQVARNLLGMGLSSADIAKATGLSETEILALG